MTTGLGNGRFGLCLQRPVGGEVGPIRGVLDPHGDRVGVVALGPGHGALSLVETELVLDGQRVELLAVLGVWPAGEESRVEYPDDRLGQVSHEDRKSTRLNSSHVKISYAVF